MLEFVRQVPVWDTDVALGKNTSCCLLEFWSVLYCGEKRVGFSLSVTSSYLSLEAWCIYFLIFVFFPVSMCVYYITGRKHKNKPHEEKVWGVRVSLTICWRGPLKLCLCWKEARAQTGISDKDNRPDIKGSEPPTGCIPCRKPKSRAAF